MSESVSKVPSFAELLRPDAINLHLQATHRDGVLEELVNQVHDIAEQPDARKALLHALQEREDLHSTGIGDGVALPHARNALVGLVDHPILVFGRSEAGIPYNSIDDSPARLFFLLVAPTVTQHLAMLARVSRLLRDTRLRKALLGAKTAEEARGLIREAEARL